MRIRWRGLELPTRVVNDLEVSTEKYGKFSAEPFERGFGTTVGNSLRRILLSSLEGAAVTRVKIAGADHEFMAIEGVQEDVADIILNIKSLVVKSHTTDPVTLKLSCSKKGPITASMIEENPSVEVLNGDLVLANLTESKSFEMELIVETGRGYIPAEEQLDDEDEPADPGEILIDAYYSPVTRVRYSTSDTRVGQKTNYDRLDMEIWTNGTITPELALVEAAKILRKHLNPFVQYFELGEQVIESSQADAQQQIDSELQKKLSMSIQELELSVRASNCLESAKIDTVGQLVTLTESELLRIRSFGKTSMREVKRKLDDLELSLGMNVETGEPAPDIDSVADDISEYDDEEDFDEDGED